MNFWTKVNSRWTKEQIASWSSLFKTVYILFPLLLYYLIGEIADVIQWILLNAILQNAGESLILLARTYSDTLIAMTYAIGLIISLAVLRKCATNEITYKEPNAENSISVSKITVTVLLSIVLSLGINYIFSITGFTGTSETYTEVSDSQYAVSFVAGLVIYGLLSPLAEEVIFRGILYNRLKRVFPLWLSMIVGALLFGVFHGNLVQGVYGTIMGIFIIWTYEKFGHFLYPLLAHAVANVGIYIITYRFH